MSALEWRAPYWLLLALVPWLMLAWQTWRPQRAEARLQRYADAHLLPRLRLGNTGDHRPWLIIAAWTAAAFAAAGPRWNSPEMQGTERLGIDIAVVVDISPSMSAQDIAPTRLARAQRELKDLVAQLDGDRLALIAYSANAYVVLPLTQDHDAFLHFVEQLDPGLVSKHGSNVGRALELAGQALAAGRRAGRAVIVISDGDYHDREALTWARRLRAQDIPVYALGIGTAAGAAVPQAGGGYVHYQGRMVVSRLEEQALTALAQAGGGNYVALRDDDSDTRTLLSGLRAASTINRYATAGGGIALHPWLLALSLSLFLWTGIRRAPVLAVALMLTAPLLSAPPPAQAASTKQEAYDALQSGSYDRATTLYREMHGYDAALGLGATAYRQRDWGTAAQHYRNALKYAHSESDRARAYYNLGTTLARLGQYSEAQSALRRALALQPNYPRASLNLTLLQRLESQRRGGVGDAAKTPQAGTGEALSSKDTRASQRGAQDVTPQAQKALGQSAQNTDTTTRGGQLSSQAAPRAAGQQPQQDQSGRNGAGLGEQQLNAVKDDTHTLLQRRFAQQDTSPGVLIVEDKPW